MSLRIDIDDMDIDRWYVLYKKSRNYCEENRIKNTMARVTDLYLDHKYTAKRVNTGGMYEFDSKEKYTEFLLTWF